GDVDEALETRVARVADPGEGSEELLPVDEPGARDAAVVLAEVEVAEAVAGEDDGIGPALLLDVHVVRVEVDPEVRRVDQLHEPDGLLARVDEWALVAVDGLDPDRDAVLRGVLRRPGEALGRPRPVLLVRTFARALPVHAVDDARELRGAELGGDLDAPAEVI